jgi:polyisoprenoid-binding protein YceI
MRALVLGLAASALIAPAAAARPYAIDKSASKLGFSGAMMGTPFQGSFRRWDAIIDFDPNNLAASRASVTVDVSSAATGDAARDEALPSSDWFHARRFPQATFVTRAITRTGANRYAAAGDLTIRGVKRAVTLPFALSFTGPTAHMTGQLTLDRTLWGVGQGQWKNGESVDKKVVVTVALTATAR